MFLQAFNRLDGFGERFAQHLFLLLKKLDLVVFFMGEFSPGSQLRLEAFPFFCLCHAATIADLPLILQLP